MRIGVPKEIKAQESRVGLTPDSVKVLTSNEHEVLVENNSGFDAGFDNDQYEKAGAKILNKAEDIFNDAEIIVKVKEPSKNEIAMIKENQIIDKFEGVILKNKVRDDSLIKLCEEFDVDKIKESETVILDKDGNDTGKTETIETKFHHLNLIRSVKGELQAWEIHYRKIE